MLGRDHGVEYKSEHPDAPAELFRATPGVEHALSALPAGVTVGVLGRTIAAEVKADVEDLGNAVDVLRAVYRLLPEDLKPERAEAGKWPLPPGSWTIPPPAGDPVPAIAETLGWRVAGPDASLPTLDLWALGPAPATQTAMLVGRTGGRPVSAFGWTLSPPGLPHPWPFHGALAWLDAGLPRLLVGEALRAKAPSSDRPGSLGFQERWTASGEGRRADVGHLLTSAFEAAWRERDPSLHLEVSGRAVLCWREGWIDVAGVRLCADAVASAAATLPVHG